jgi:tetratricopeptide (TPR) repeat protein
VTTSTETTKTEIARFLSGSEPGVLCIAGEWGVGKTFLWRTVLDQLRKSNKLDIKTYSYVSLFGLNSLDDVKAALFENMEWLDQDATSFTQRGKAGAKALVARAKKLSELAGALPWESLLEKYKFRRTDEFDNALMRYVDTTIIDLEEINNQARALQEQQRIEKLHGTYEAAWRAFHESFDDDEDRVVDEIVSGAKKSFEVVSLANLNETILILKQLGRDTEAKELLNFFAENRRDYEYWSPRQPFLRGPLDPDVSATADQRKPSEPKEFDIAAGLVRAGKDYDSDTIANLAAVPVKTYYDLIISARSDHLRLLVLSALEFRRISNASDDMSRVVGLMEEALRMVGRQSRLNALRIEKYGVSIDKGRTSLDNAE